MTIFRHEDDDITTEKYTTAALLLTRFSPARNRCISTSMDARVERERISAARNVVYAALLKSLTPKAMEDSAKKLGFWRRGALSLRQEEELAVVTDFAIHHYRPDGKNTVERTLANRGTTFDATERAVLEAMARSRFTVLELEASEDGVTFAARDRLYDETVVIGDEGLGKIAQRGQLIATRIVLVGEIAVLTGAALPFDRELADDLRTVLERRWPGAVPAGLRGVSAAEQGRIVADLVTVALRGTERLRDEPLEPRTPEG